MGLSINEYTYTGDTVFDLNFATGFASRDDVTCWDVTDPDNAIAVTFTWLTDAQVDIDDAGMPTDTPLEFRRTVSKTELPVDITVAGSATRANLQLVALHAMRVMHEVLDGRGDAVADGSLISSESDLLDEIYNTDYVTVYTDERDA